MESNLAVLFIFIFLLTVLSFIFSLSTYNKAKITKDKYFKLLREGVNIGNLEEFLFRELKEEIAEILKNQEKLKAAVESSLMGIGFVRFNAFPNVGGEMSFSLAVLDADNNGIVLTCIYGREESRIYAKRLEKGKSELAISQEEKEAIQRAKERLELIISSKLRS